MSKNKPATKGQVESIYPTASGAEYAIIKWLDGKGPNPVSSTNGCKVGKLVYLTPGGGVSDTRVLG